MVIVAGEDLARTRDFTACVAINIDHPHAWIHGIKLWPHVDYGTIIEDTARLYRVEGFSILGVDSSSMGGPIVETYQGLGLNVQAVLFSSQTKHDMVSLLRQVLQNDILQLPKPTDPTITELLQQIGEQEIEPGVSATAKYSHPQGRHDDLFWALCIACYVGRTWLLGEADYRLYGMKGK